MFGHLHLQEATYPLSGIALLAFVGLVAALVVRNLLATRLPKGIKPLPGPKGLPVAGNAFDIPKSHSWLKFKEWADEYGPIYQINAFGNTIVIISKESVANELLGLRGALYSDRPANIMISLITDSMFIGVGRWGNYWRRARRCAQYMLSSAVVQEVVPKQTTEARQMVIDLVKEPSRYSYWLERAGAITSVKQVYGLTVPRGLSEERHVHEIVFLMDQIDRLSMPGLYLVEFIPALLRLPMWLAPFKREAKRLRDRHFAYISPLLRQQFTKYDENLPESPESIARRFIRTKIDWNLSEHEMVWVLASIYGGASGTTSTAMQTIILNMCLYPQWQQRIQDELEAVVGDGRLPNIDDSRDLPTIRAVIKESMRWRPVLSGGLPHAVIKDDVYEGYHIPKDAVIIPNQWAIFRNQEDYPDPENFRPERWLEPSWPTFQEPLTVYPNLKRFAAFGHGRRICPGLEVAERALLLQVSSLFWACSVRRKRDSAGKEIEVPYYDYTGEAISTPREFLFDVEVHSDGRLRALEQAACSAHASET